MSFFTQASFVMDPNVYGVGKLYVPKPTDGSGDLTFTRASNGTRVNQDGLIEKVRTNLLPYSQDFSNWSTNSCTVSTNTTANPLNGAVDADTITFTGATTQKYVIQAFSFNGNYTVSVYLKAGTNQFVQFLIGSDASPYVNFDLVNGISNAFGSTANIVSVGNGWYRCSMSFTSTIGTHVFLNAVNSLSAYRFDATSSTGTLIAFGYQLETGDIATDYIPTTTSAVSVGPLANIPRLNYGADGCPSLLLEPQRTNVCLWSEAFDNSGWSKLGISVTANNTTSPSGYQDADKLVANAGSGTRVVYQGILPAGVSTTSVYAKAGEFGGIVIASGQYGAFFNLTTGEYRRFYASAPVSYSITSVGSGWYRCTITINSATTDNLYIGPNDNYSNTLGVTGNGTDGIYVWGAQLEAGSYATSYIPTLSSAVTRVADAASKTGIGSLIGGTSGTIFYEIHTNPNMSNASYKQLFYYIDASALQGYAFVDGANVIKTNANLGNMTASIVLAQDTTYKIAIAYAPSDFKLYVNGAEVASSTSGTPKDFVDILSIGSYAGASEWNEFGFKQILHFKTRLSNADLARLTSL